MISISLLFSITMISISLLFSTAMISISLLFSIAMISISLLFSIAMISISLLFSTAMNSISLLFSTAMNSISLLFSIAMTTKTMTKSLKFHINSLGTINHAGKVMLDMSPGKRYGKRCTQAPTLIVTEFSNPVPDCSNASTSFRLCGSREETPSSASMMTMISAQLMTMMMSVQTLIG